MPKLPQGPPVHDLIVALRHTNDTPPTPLTGTKHMPGIWMKMGHEADTTYTLLVSERRQWPHTSRLLGKVSLRARLTEVTQPSETVPARKTRYGLKLIGDRLAELTVAEFTARNSAHTNLRRADWRPTKPERPEVDHMAHILEVLGKLQEEPRAMEPNGPADSL